jgi:hypothetical protein
MSTLCWPPPAHEEGSVRPGQFWNDWPWPAHLMTTPTLARGLQIQRRIPFCVLEGEDNDDNPFCRAYELWILEDGRRALGFFDAELEMPYVHGWF